MVELNFDINEYNKEIKTVYRQINFQNLEGEFIEVKAFFDRIGNNKQHACIYNIDISGNKEDHIWLRDVVDSNTDIWKELQGGEQLCLYGQVYSYTDKDGDKKYSINLDNEHFKNNNLWLIQNR